MVLGAVQEMLRKLDAFGKTNARDAGNGACDVTFPVVGLCAVPSRE